MLTPLVAVGDLGQGLVGRLVHVPDAAAVWRQGRVASAHVGEISWVDEDAAPAKGESPAEATWRRGVDNVQAALRAQLPVSQPAADRDGAQVASSDAAAAPDAAAPGPGQCVFHRIVYLDGREPREETLPLAFTRCDVESELVWVRVKGYPWWPAKVRFAAGARAPGSGHALRPTELIDRRASRRRARSGSSTSAFSTTPRRPASTRSATSCTSSARTPASGRCPRP